MSRLTTPVITALMLAVVVLATQPERVPAWTVIGTILLGGVLAMLIVYVEVRRRGGAA
jgi:RsiW-degrading membrane proteinase PrsW (M82 family)